MKFGNNSVTYDSARKKYPTDVMDYVFSNIEPSHIVLDVGCGTGIATRQLAQKITYLHGSDIDSRMIQTAQTHGGNITYFVAPTNILPYDDSMFDAITSFGAFHWFCDDKSISELLRILKDTGTFIIVNKHDTGDFKKSFTTIIEQVLGYTAPKSVKAAYNPKTILQANNFLHVTEKTCTHVEKFSIQEALAQFQSMSLWDIVPQNKHAYAIELLTEYLEQTAVQGIVHREISITVVVGNK